MSRQNAFIANRDIRICTPQSDPDSRGDGARWEISVSHIMKFRSVATGQWPMEQSLRQGYLYEYSACRA